MGGCRTAGVYQDALENGDHEHADQLHQRLKELHTETVRAANESREMKRVKALGRRIQESTGVKRNVALQEWTYTLKDRR